VISISCKTTCVLLASLLVVAAGCGADEDDTRAMREPDPPVGQPLLPDLAPAPQRNVLTRKVKGRWRIFFNTNIVNVGKGAFILRSKRPEGGNWRTEQDVPYSEEGAKTVPIQAPLVWGGDGHEHWHVIRVAAVSLVPLGPSGRVVSDAKPRVDTKVGFCFYDHTHLLPRGPEDDQYSAHGCGHRDDTLIGMGLSPGWEDVYLQTLPGQSIDVTGLPDGKYRLLTVIDEQRRFHEASRQNNRTWIDLEIQTTPQGVAAPRIGTGPVPR